MECRLGLAMRIIMSVRPTVRQTRALSQNEINVPKTASIISRVYYTEKQESVITGY